MVGFLSRRSPSLHRILIVHLILYSWPRSGGAGCQPVSWKDGPSAFPHLMHHPSGVGGDTGPGAHGGGGDSYYKETLRMQGGEAHGGTRRGNVGTWHGPAPKGQGIAPRHAQDNPEIPAGCVQLAREPDCVILPGGVRMPLVGLGTFRTTDAGDVKRAVELGYRHFDCARIYGNEEMVGEGLREFLQSGPDAGLPCGSRPRCGTTPTGRRRWSNPSRPRSPTSDATTWIFY